MTEERKLTPAAEAALQSQPTMSQFLNKDDLIAELRKENEHLRLALRPLACINVSEMIADDETVTVDIQVAAIRNARATLAA